jgi:hypothetical protein
MRRSCHHYSPRPQQRRSPRLSPGQTKAAKTRRPPQPANQNAHRKLTAARPAAGELVAAFATGGRASAQLQPSGTGWRGVVDADDRGRRGVMEAAREVADFDEVINHSSAADRLLAILESHPASHSDEDAPDNVIDSLFDEVGEAVMLLSQHDQFFDWAVAKLLNDERVTVDEANRAFNKSLISATSR